MLLLKQAMRKHVPPLVPPCPLLEVVLAAAGVPRCCTELLGPPEPYSLCSVHKRQASTTGLPVYRSVGDRGRGTHTDIDLLVLNRGACVWRSAGSAPAQSTLVMESRSFAMMPQ